MHFLGFTALGLAIGTVGTLIGAGGGFILVPILLFLYPFKSPFTIAAISMLAIAANATSGTITYAIKKQVHWPSALLFTIFALPGIGLGILLGERVNREVFEGIFGIMMICISTFLILRSKKKKTAQEPVFTFDKSKMFIGSAVSTVVGVLASFLGVGGGIIHVPLLSEVLKYPVHLATGTSHFILGVTALVAVWKHWELGHYIALDYFVPYLIVGIVFGAQIGAQLSKRVSSRKILQFLSLALIITGVRLIMRGFF